MVDLDRLPDLPVSPVHRAGPGVRTGICDAGWFLIDPATGDVEVRGAEADVLASWTVPPDALGRSGRDRITVDERRGLVIVTTPARVRIVHRDGTMATVDVPEWVRNGGAAVADPAPRDRPLVWLVTAGESTVGQLASQPREGVVLVVDGDRGEVLDRLALDDGHPEGYELSTLDEQRVLLSGGYGQDGSQTWIFRASDAGTRAVIETRALGWTRVASDVDRRRGEVLYMPHDDDDVEIRDLDGEIRTVLHGSDIFGDPEEAEDEPESFGYVGWFLDDTRLVVTTWTDRALVLDRRSGEPLGWLEPGPGLGIDGSVGRSHVLASGRTGTVLLAVGT